MESMIDIGRMRGDTGAERAARRAERVSPGWIDAAVREIKRVVLSLPAEFTMEQARCVAAVSGTLESPPDGRAWGHVTREAKRLKIIVRVPGAFKAAASSNGSPKPCYRAGPGALQA